MRRSVAISSGRRCGSRARKRGDSGSSHGSTSAAANGSAPPAKKSPRHPIAGSAGIAASPASVAPSGTQTIVTVTASGPVPQRHVLAGERRRVRNGAAQPEPRQEAEHARARRRRRPPPRPSSSRRRRAGCRAARCGARSDRRRARRSRRRPSSRGSRARPPGRTRCAARAHSRMSVGIATPISWLSMPSKTMVSAVSATSQR